MMAMKNPQTVQDLLVDKAYQSSQQERLQSADALNSHRDQTGYYQRQREHELLRDQLKRTNDMGFFI